MATLSGYILKLTLRPLMAAVVIALLLLLVERMLRLMDLILEERGSLNALLKMLAFLVPHYLGLALPAAFFLGILLTFGRLQRDSELDAMRASGIGLHQLLVSTLGLAAVVAVTTALILSVLQPHARYTYRAIIHTLTHGPLNKYLQDDVFVEIGDTTYMAEQIDSEKRRFRRVFAYTQKPDGSSSTATSQSGELIPRPESELTTLVLDDGVRLTVQPRKDAPADAPPEDWINSTVTFERYNLPVNLEQDEVFRSRGDDERELTLSELWAQRDSPPDGAERSDLIGAFNDRLVRTLSVLFLPVLAIPLAVGGRRAKKSYGMVVGIVVLVGYNKILNSGEALVASESYDPLFAQWLPFAVFALGSLALFHRAAFTVGGERALAGLWQRFTDIGRAVRNVLPRRKQEI